jgi:HK97 family phage portal protein
MFIQEQFTKMKIFGYNISKEQRSVNIAPTNSYGIPYGGLSASLSSEAAMRLSAVYRCVDVKSNDIATMPWDIMVYNDKNEWVKDEFHFSYNLLNSQPNPSMTKFDFMKALWSKVELDGNAYAEIKRDTSGNPIGLVLLNGAITMYVRGDWSVYYDFEEDYSHRAVRIEGEDMIHVKNFSYNGLQGVSTITHATNITSLAASADGQAKGYYVNGVNMNGIITVPGKITPTNATALKTSFKEAVAYNSTTEVGGGVIVLEGGADFKAIQISPKDAQMLETRQFNVVDICRFFGVHPSKAFDTTVNSYGTAESYQLAYITDTMTPCKTRIENEFNRKLFRPSQRDRIKLNLDIKKLRSADLETLVAHYSGLFQCGVYSPDDICRELGLPIDPNGKGGRRYVQVNLAELGEKPEPVQNKNNGAGKEGNKEEENEGN